jgi:hypothetical protein
LAHFSEFGAAVQAQWPQITADLDHATPAALRLVTAASATTSDLGLNHQVLACGYGTSETEFTVQEYDPNSSQDDGIYIRFAPWAPTKPTTFAQNINISHPIRGLFPHRPRPGRATRLAITQNLARAGICRISVPCSCSAS